MQVFFPRSIEGEIATRDATREQKRTKSQQGKSTLTNLFATRSDVTQSRNTHGQTGGTYLLTSSPVKQSFPLDMYDTHEEQGTFRADSIDSKHWTDNVSPPHLPPIRPNRRHGETVELGGIDFKLTEANLSQHNLGVPPSSASNLHPMLHNFTSPIGLNFLSSYVPLPLTDLL
jgi:hypothetical protein